ncbi:hypothetical protein Q8A67_008188 [Cirrhinus molitorella]|uniref:Uncharacterized protein n=1 Tax=Cirrhinus molitorella TaxID=172907 RepID=A0AA88TSJ8_9TELE|nr:hypothetical protein Q8A67_008188 [Cirrhinus molitorella]
MNRNKRKVGRPAKYRTVDDTAQMAEGTHGSRKGQDTHGVTAKIATLKAEIFLLQDECEYLSKEIAAMSSIGTAAAVPGPSELQERWDSSSSSSQSSQEKKKRKIKGEKKRSKKNRK